jgi:hypothetical protein
MTFKITEACILNSGPIAPTGTDVNVGGTPLEWLGGRGVAIVGGAFTGGAELSIDITYPFVTLDPRTTIPHPIIDPDPTKAYDDGDGKLLYAAQSRIKGPGTYPFELPRSTITAGLLVPDGDTANIEVWIASID